MSTATATEYAVAIDTEIAEVQRQLAINASKVSSVIDQLRRTTGAERTTERRYGRLIDSWDTSLRDTIAAARELAETDPADDDDYRPRLAARQVAELDALNERDGGLRDRLAELEYEHLCHGWSRFYVVDNSNGHIHSSMGCTTCYPTTSFRWVTSLSGQTEAEAVEELGEILCSVCFPSAPVAWREGESKATKEARAEREAKKAARAAAKVEKALIPEDPEGGYETLTTDGRRGDRITTVHAAKAWLKSYYEWLTWNDGHPSYRTEDAEAIAALLVGRPKVKQDTAEAVLADAKKRAEKG